MKGYLGYIAHGLRENGGPIMVSMDNYDLNVYTPNGTRETHDMAIQYTQHPSADSHEEFGHNMEYDCDS